MKANKQKGCRLCRCVLRRISSDAHGIATTVSLSLHPLHYTLLIARNLGRISDFNLAAYNAPRATDLQISLVFFSPSSRICVNRERTRICTYVSWYVHTHICMRIHGGCAIRVLYGEYPRARRPRLLLALLVYASASPSINNGPKIVWRRQLL